MSLISQCCSPCIPTSPPGKISGGILVAASITMLVIGILASQPASTLGLSQTGAQAMMGVGGAILCLYVLQVLLCRCREDDGFCHDLA